MTQLISINAQHPLVGTWISVDDFSEVEITISADTSNFQVAVIDKSDGELAEVYDVKHADTKLTFSLHWRSTGRFTKYLFDLTSKDKVSASYTYSGQEVWVRSK